MNIQKTAEKIEAKAQALGFTTRVKFAETGTIYIVARHFGMDLKIRVADHQDLYATSDYTCDEIEGNYKGAVKFLEARAAEAVAAMEASESAPVNAIAKDSANARDAYIAAMESGAADVLARNAEIKARGGRMSDADLLYIAGM